jgi:hypothetical protein
LDNSHAIMEDARKTILPRAETRLYGARRIFDLDTPRDQQWSTSETWALAYMRHALGLSGFYRDTSFDDPSRVLLVIPDGMDIRMDLLLTVGIAPEITAVKGAGKGAFGQAFAPSAATMRRWQDIADRCEEIYGAGYDGVAYTGIIRAWSSLPAQPGRPVDYRSTYFLGSIDRDGSETEADAAGLLNLLETPRASCLLMHRQGLESLVPRILERSDLLVVKVLG